MALVHHLVMVLCTLTLAAVVLSQDASENEVPVCPRRDDPKGNATILADPHNCTVFYLCSNGIAHPFACPPELKFNDALKVCDWPENVDCEDEGSGGLS